LTFDIYIVIKIAILTNTFRLITSIRRGRTNCAVILILLTGAAFRGAFNTLGIFIFEESNWAIAIRLLPKPDTVDTVIFRANTGKAF
jgi:hypothetical protein